MFGAEPPRDGGSDDRPRTAHALACHNGTVISPLWKNTLNDFYALTDRLVRVYWDLRIEIDRLGRVEIVTKPELGTKHLCASCGTKFYDLNRAPATCPKCGTVASIAAKGPASRPSKASPKVVEVEEDEAAVAEKADVEIVSLDEAEEEENIGAAGIDDDDVEDIDDGDVDDTFLEEDDEDDDVPGIVVARDEDEEI